jgi:excinuclease UvrABC nuclease subunit
MGIVSDYYEFTQSNVNGSPEQPGVYELLDNGVTTYFGSATVSIRNRLQSHKAGNDGPCTQHSTHYRREVCSNPRERERQLLQEYYRLNGRLPRCNNVMP